MVERSEQSSFSEFFEFFKPNEDKQEILKVVPSFFSNDPQTRQDKFDAALKEMAYFTEKFHDNPQLSLLIKNKLRGFIYLNPFSDIVEKAISFAKYYFPTLEEDVVSRFYPQESVVSIQRLADYLENPNEKNRHASFELPEKMKLEEYKYLLGDIVNFNGGKISHLERILCWFPDYLNRYFQTKNCLMTVPGALPLDWRFYIAIMAVSCYGCDYLFNHLSHQFLIYGGDKEWLIKGAKEAPTKLQNLRKLNIVLAYKPWDLRSATSEHIKELLKGKNQWSIPELMHAMTILVYYHAWSCFCMANGIKLESDMNFFLKDKSLMTAEEKSPKQTQDQHEPRTLENEEICDMLFKLSEESQIEDVNGVNANELRKKDKFQLHQDLLFEASSLPIPQDQSPKDKDEERESGVGFYRYMGDEVGKNEDFNYHKYTLLKSHDYNFGTHGMALFNEFLPELANSLHEELNYLFRMTKNCFENKKEINTEPFRRAIRYYTENIYGYYHEHYDYAQYNKLMPKQFKVFVKMIVKSPYEITRQSSKKTQIKLMDSETCHTILLAILARLQVSLVYTLESLGRFLYDKQ